MKRKANYVSSSSSSLTRRRLLEDFKTPLDFINKIIKSKKIVIITGAGISVSSGIPDFRSKGSGLYESLDCPLYGIPSAELLFDLPFFLIDPEPFYKFAINLIPQHKLSQLAKESSKDILEDKVSFPASITHKFICKLGENKKLLRNYSQNIDGLELLAGLDSKKLVQCHGSIDVFICTICKKKRKLKDCLAEITRGSVVYCSCKKQGVLKPDITFFGEVLPDVFFRAMEQDLPRVDLVLVMGTSLKVGGSVVEFLRRVRGEVPQVLINKQSISIPKEMDSEGFDLELLGECDAIVEHLIDLLGLGDESTRQKSTSSLFVPREASLDTSRCFTISTELSTKHV